MTGSPASDEADKADEDAQDRRLLRQMAQAPEDEASRAWAQLFHRYERRIRKTIRNLHRISPWQAVEDLLQDVAVRLFEKADTYNPQKPAAPWVMAVARNLVLDWLQVHGNQRVDTLGDEETMEALVHEHVDGHRRAIPSVVPQQVIDDCRDRHWKAFVRQRPRDAEALYHACIEGWSMVELAEFLEVQVESAKVIMHRARAAARAALMPCEPDRENP